ncbi:MAG: MopE-related protein [Myxococcota bacterium]
MRIPTSRRPRTLPSGAIPLLALLCACSGDKDPADSGTDADTATTEPTDPNDQDGDGFSPPQDCDDHDPDVHPGAVDTPYDGIDSDCGGGSDYDADGDGHDALQAPFGDDCDDTDPDVHPGATEACNGVDDDCDGATDPPGSQGEVSWYADADLDGYGDPATEVVACDPPDTDSVQLGGDCDDSAPTAYPGAPTVACDGLDNDCDPKTIEAGEVTLDGVVVANLQSAIGSAGPGAVITLCEGRYPISSTTLAEAITIAGASSAFTTIDAGGTGPVFRVTSASPVTLQGVALTNGLGLQDGGERRGGGLYLDPGVRVDGIDLALVGNVAGAGAGAWLSDGATLAVTGGEIADNHATDAYAIVSMGGGIYAGDAAQLDFDGVDVHDNDADACGGISLGANALLDGAGTSTVRANATLGLAGGGVCVDGSQLRHVTVADNVSLNAGGGIEGWDVVLEDVTVTGNSADLAGGGAALQGTCNIVDSTFADNVAGIDGGGLDLALGTTTITASTLERNVTTFFASYGGGVSLFQGTVNSVDTDWASAADDNTPADLELIGLEQGFSWDGLATFTCTDDGDFGLCE